MKIARALRHPLTWVTGIVVFFVIMPFQFMKEINIASGRVRHSIKVLGITVHASVNDTELTGMLTSDESNQDHAYWRTVNIGLRWYDRETCWKFRGAIHQIDELKRLWNEVDFYAEARIRSAKDVAFLWRAQENQDAAGEYLVRLQTYIYDHGIAKKTLKIEPANLPSTDEILKSKKDH